MFQYWAICCCSAVRLFAICLTSCRDALNCAEPNADGEAGIVKLDELNSHGVTLPQFGKGGLRRCEFVTEEVTHQNADALKGYARSTWHRYTGRIPVQKRDALLNGVVQRCIELSPADRSGRIHVRGLARSRRNSLKRRIDCHSLLLNNSVANMRKTEAKMRSATTSG